MHSGHTFLSGGQRSLEAERGAAASFGVWSAKQDKVGEAMAEVDCSATVGVV